MHFRAHRTGQDQALYENLKVQGGKYCIAERKLCAERVMCFSVSIKQNALSVLIGFFSSKIVAQ